MDMTLVGDIGGTNTRLYLFSEADGPGAPVIAKTFSSQQHDSLEDILKIFAADSHHRISQAIFGVAGPVKSGRVEVTNLPWVIEEASLRRQLGTDRVKVMNDLETAAYALPFLKPSDLLTLNTGQPQTKGTMAVIAPGTGLGEAFLTHGEGDSFSAHPSEGGHVSFAPRDDKQIQLLQHLFARFDHVSYERVCSGIGIPNIYHFFKTVGNMQASAGLDADLENVSDPTPLIVDNAIKKPGSCPLCEQVLTTFVEILGAAAGNLALKVAATGGVFIAGGIAPRITDYLKMDLFMNAFTAKGRMHSLLETIPVHVILKPEIAVFGSACYALFVNRKHGKK